MRASIDCGLRRVLEQSNVNRNAYGVLHVAIGLRLGVALRAQLQRLLDLRFCLDILIRVQIRRPSDIGNYIMFGEGERQRAGHVKRGTCARIRFLSIGAVRCSELAKDVVEDARLEIEYGIVIRRGGVVGFQPRLRGGFVFRAQLGNDTDAGGIAGIEDVLGFEAITGAAGRRVADVDGNTGAGLVLGFRKLDHLRLDEAAVTLQIKLVQPGDDVVGLPVDETLDRCCSTLVIDHGLAKFECQAEERVVHRSGIGECLVVDRYGVFILVDLGAVERLGVVARGECPAGEQIDCLTRNGFALAVRQLDEVGFVDVGCARVIRQPDDEVLLATDEPADAPATAAEVLDGIFGHEGVRTDVNPVVGVVDVTNFGRVRYRWVDFQLDGRSRIHVGRHAAVHRGVNVGVGKLKAESKPCFAVGEQPRFGL